MSHLIFLSTVYPTPWEPHKGPANARLVAALRRLGVTVSVIAPVPWTAWRAGRTGAPAPGTYYPIFWYPPGIARHTYHKWMLASVRRTFERVLKAQPAPFAILAFWTHPDGTTALRLGELCSAPVGVIAPGSDIMLLPTDPKRRAVISSTLAQASHVFAVGSEISRRVVTLGAPPSAVSNFIQGVELDNFVPGDRAAARAQLGLRPEGPLLLWIGNMVAVKAADRVILAARHLRDKWPTLQVAMVGDGPLMASLQQMAADSELPHGTFRFPGAVRSDSLPAWYQAADLFVLPSRSEGVPNVLLESMAVGLPFVASAVGGIADLLPFGASVLVPEGDLDSLRRAIDSILGASPTARPQPIQRDIHDGARHIMDALHARAEGM